MVKEKQCNNRERQGIAAKHTYIHTQTHTPTPIHTQAQTTVRISPQIVAYFAFEKTEPHDVRLFLNCCWRLAQCLPKSRKSAWSLSNSASRVTEDGLYTFIDFLMACILGGVVLKHSYLRRWREWRKGTVEGRVSSTQSYQLVRLSCWCAFTPKSAVLLIVVRQKTKIRPTELDLLARTIKTFRFPIRAPLSYKTATTVCVLPPWEWVLCDKCRASCLFSCVWTGVRMLCEQTQTDCR